jgi:hypothetical protein
MRDSTARTAIGNTAGRATISRPGVVARSECRSKDGVIDKNEEYVIRNDWPQREKAPVETQVVCVADVTVTFGFSD